MTRDDATGVWSVTGTAAWKNQFYLYDVEVFAPSTGQVEHNLVTDPYSVALASEFDAHPDRQPVRRGAPAGRLVDVRQARAAVRPKGISLYELHVRDFSINDATVPAAERGTYARVHADRRRRHAPPRVPSRTPA